MVKSLYDEFVTNSHVYKEVKLDVNVRQQSWGLGFGPIAMGMALDHVDSDIYCPLQALEIDKGIKLDNEELDTSPYLQELFLALAQMADGAEAHDMLCQYLKDSELPHCQLYIAQHHAPFFENITDRSNLLDLTKTYLEIVS